MAARFGQALFQHQHLDIRAFCDSTGIFQPPLAHMNMQIHKCIDIYISVYKDTTAPYICNHVNTQMHKYANEEICKHTSM